MTKKTDTPAIRFKGFSDTWEQRKLTEFVEFFSGLTYTPNDVQENGTLVLRSSNVSNGEVVDADNVYVNPQVVNSENVKVGDIVVVVRNGSRSLIGKHAQIKAFMPNTVIGAFMTGIRSECPEFTNALLNTSRFEEEIAMNMGATINQITGYMFSKMEFKVPCLDEQKKIGEYFEKLDNLITLHQRKYEKLHNIKKSMLEKMFPKNGSNVPEIRFKGFTEAWEQRKFSELYEKVSRKNDLTYGKDDIISVANMYFKADSYITDESYLLTYNIFELGDIAFEGNKSKNYAHGRFVENTIGNGIVSHVFDVFKPIMKPYDLQFWKYAINNEQLMGGILLRSTKASTMMTNLVANDFLQETFLVPAYPEQQKIGAFFQELDRLITLHQRKPNIYTGGYYAE